MTGPIVEHADTVVVRETGFLEESPGVRSSTRLIMVWLAALASVLVATLSFYVVYGETHKLTLDQFIILAIVAGLGALVANGIIAINRRGGSDG